MQLSVLKTSVMVGVKLTSQKVTLTVYQAAMGHCSLSFLRLSYSSPWTPQSP